MPTGGHSCVPNWPAGWHWWESIPTKSPQRQTAYLPLGARVRQDCPKRRPRTTIRQTDPTSGDSLLDDDGGGRPKVDSDGDRNR